MLPLNALLVLVWPLGMALIFGAARVLARRVDDPVPPAAHGDAPPAADSWMANSIRALIVLAAGFLIVLGAMWLLGLLVTHEGPRIDGSIYSWTRHHRVHSWYRVNLDLTKVADTWTAVGAAGGAAGCLAVIWPAGKRWIPVAALTVAILADHFLTRGVHHLIHRIGPPDAPAGTFPSGGCDRAVLVFGLIAYLLWRETSGRRSTAVWAAAAAAAVAFNEAYSRAYLTVHWFTDVLGGLIYGGLLLTVCILAVRVAAGQTALTRGRVTGAAADVTAMARARPG